ncbi:MAG: hypothetical protein KJ645_11210, partial [Planctomycetes bacterium]|nr:hypothetical protein [Planctomycetota bacterium]
MEEYEKIKELVELMRDYDLVEIEIKEGGREIKLKKAGQCMEMPMTQMTSVMPGAMRSAMFGGP